jgi:hypothetical protein
MSPQAKDFHFHLGSALDAASLCAGTADMIAFHAAGIRRDSTNGHKRKTVKSTIEILIKPKE